MSSSLCVYLALKSLLLPLPLPLIFIADLEYDARMLEDASLFLSK
jgi:hypothetical protein